MLVWLGVFLCTEPNCQDLDCEFSDVHCWLAVVRSLIRLELSQVMGFNLPPSQSQLHMQCMLPPFTPFHFTMTRQQKHFGAGRFFTHEYIRAVLATQVAMPFNDSTLGEEVIAFYKEQGTLLDASLFM